MFIKYLFVTPVNDGNKKENKRKQKKKISRVSGRIIYTVINQSDCRDSSSHAVILYIKLFFDLLHADSSS